jgi:hypothetical protein
MDDDPLGLNSAIDRRDLLNSTLDGRRRRAVEQISG